MNLKRFLSWQKNRRDSFLAHFFNSVDIEDEAIKKSIIDWIFRLNSKNIQIDNFSLLFTKYDEITFPIKVCGHPQHLELKDFNGNDFYFCYDQYCRTTQYYIGKRTKDFDKQLTYLFTKEDGILLKDFEINKLDKNEINTTNMFSFNYDLNDITTTVILETRLKKASMTLEITYETIDFLHCNKIVTKLFDLMGKCYHADNVFVLPEHLLENIKELLESKTILGTASFIKILK